MKGDFTRTTFKRARNFNAVLMQQGRAQLDADWNEQAQIALDRARGMARSTIGASGAEGRAFRIAAHEPIDDFEFIDGWQGQNSNPSTPVSLCIDHTRSFQGHGSLRVTNANSIQKNLDRDKLLDLTRRKTLYFAVLSPDITLPVSTASTLPVLHLYQSQTSTDISVSPDASPYFQSGGWSVYSCTLPTDKPIPEPIDGYGFSGLTPGMVYNFDALSMDFQSSLQPLGLSLDPGGWYGVVKDLPASFDSIAQFRGSPSLRLPGNSTWLHPFDVPQDPGGIKNLTITAKADAKQFSVQFGLQNGSQVALKAKGTGQKDEDGWQEYSIDLSKLTALNTLVTSLSLSDLGENGYQIGAITSGLSARPDFHILGGDEQFPARLYVDGILCQRERTETYLTQGQYPDPPSLNLDDSITERVDLVYLDVFPRHVTYLEDPGLLEPALGGADTSTRLETVSQVKVLQGVTGNTSERSQIPPLLKDEFAELVHIENETLTTVDNPYQGTENRLYRVEIHSVTLDPAGKNSFVVFKWSKENGITAVNLSGDVSQGTSTSGTPNTTEIHLTSLGRDADSRIKPGDLLEISDDLTDLLIHAPGDLLQVIGPVDRSDEYALTVQPIQFLQSGVQSDTTLSRTYLADSHAKVRRWDGFGVVPITTDGLDSPQRFKLSISGEDSGVQVQFGGSDPQVGDYWTFAARVETQSIEKLAAEPPAGIEHRYCPLAVIHWQCDANQKLQLVDVIDQRPTFNPLTELQATDIKFDGSCYLSGSENVQSAIESLAQVEMSGGCACTITIWPNGPMSLQQAINHKLLDNGGSIFMQAGTYILNEGVTVSGRHDITIEGTGASRVVLPVTGTGALLDIDQQSERIKIREVDLIATRGDIVLNIADSSCITVENCTLIQSPLDPLSSLEMGSVVLNQVNGCKLSNCSFVGMTGIEFVGDIQNTSSDIVLSDSFLLARDVGIGAGPHSITNQLKLSNIVIQGWDNDLRQYLSNVWNNFRTYSSTASTDQVSAINDLFRVIDKHIHPSSVSIVPTSYPKTTSASIALMGTHNGWSLDGGRLFGSLGLILFRAENGVISNTEIDGEPSIFAFFMKKVAFFHDDLEGHATIYYDAIDLHIDDCLFEGSAGFLVGHESGAFDEVQSIIPMLPSRFQNPYYAIAVMVDGLHVSSNHFQCYSNGISISGSGTISRNINITDNRFDNGQTGVLDRTSCAITIDTGPDDDSVIGDCLIARNNIVKTGNGISVSRRGAIVITNRIYVDTAGVFGINLLADACIVQDNIITAIRGPLQDIGTGIIINQSSLQSTVRTNTQIIGNRIEGKQQKAVAIRCNISDLILKENVFNGVSVGVTAEGVAQQTINGMQMIGNKITMEPGQGVAISLDNAQTTHSIIMDNTIQVKNSSGGYINHINLKGNSLRIVGNTIEGDGNKPGIYITGVKDGSDNRLDIENNIIKNVGEQGIMVTGDLSDNEIAINDNRIVGSQADCIGIKVDGDPGDPKCICLARNIVNIDNGQGVSIQGGNELTSIIFSNNQVYVATLTDGDAVDLLGKNIVAMGNEISDPNTYGASMDMHGDLNLAITAIGNITSHVLNPCLSDGNKIIIENNVSLNPLVVL